MLQRIAADRLVFSLDLRNGEPVTAGEVWGAVGVQGIVERVVQDGARQMIVLDLGRVGTRRGTGTVALCANLVRRHPGLSVYAGGGIRDQTDIEHLANAGVAGVLVSSAIHDGTLAAGADGKL